MLASFVAIGFGAAGCGGSSASPNAKSAEPSVPVTKPGPPVGAPLLPELVPQPADALHTRQINGHWYVLFSSIIVNTGEGDFALSATRTGNDWHVWQEVHYSISGATLVPVPAQMVWAGDGHNHWHVERIASNWMVPLAANGQPSSAKSLVDSKIGFCMYDVRQVLPKGPHNAQHRRQTCGHSPEDTNVAQGLSVGWEDVYDFTLPGQRIEITNLADGNYRLYSQVDQNNRFREASHAHDLTWVDFTLGTSQGGVRTALVTRVGPRAY